MATGYVRQDTANEIADGEFITAEPLDAEFDGLEAAFNSSTGHNHDGTTGNGGGITKVGPTQDLIVSGTQMLPKTTNTLDLGSATFKMKSSWWDGVVTSDSFVGPVTGAVTGNASTATALATARTIAISGQVTGTATSFNGTANISIDVPTLSASSLNAGTVPSARIAGVYNGITGVGAVTTGSIGSGFGSINIGSSIFTGNGSGITAINATNISTGTISNSRLPSSISVANLSASDRVTGSLTHQQDGGYINLGTYNVATHGAGSGRLHYRGTAREARFDSADGDVDVITTGAFIGGLMHEINNGYLYIGSYSTADYGNGYGQLYWDDTIKRLSLRTDNTDTATFRAATLQGDLAAGYLTGNISSSRLSGSYTGIVGTGTLNAGAISSGFGSINIGGNTFTGSGSGISSLNASNISSGTLSSSRLGTSAGDADWVRERMAENAHQEVGMYALALGPNSGHTAGTNYAGSSLNLINFGVDADDNDLHITYGSSLPGTWKAMQTSDIPGGQYGLGIFMRVS
jgi:hypothetical protein